jgi:N-acetylglucosamine-6-phosphate deacetylase
MGFQINGGYGHDFSTFESEGSDREQVYIAGLEDAAKRIVQTGTTSIVPTIITQRKEMYRQVRRHRFVIIIFSY